VGTLALSDPTFAAAQTFLGDKGSVSFRQGTTTAQVQITVDGGKITAINTVSINGTPGWPASCIISSITSMALAAQSASVQGISCASYSSAAWKQSLASAISKAGTAITQSSTTTTTTPAPTQSTPTRTTPALPVVPVNPNVPRYGGGDDDGQEFGHQEGGEGGFGGGDDGYRHPFPTRSQRTLPTRAPVTPVTPTPAKSAAPSTTPSTANSLGLTMGSGGIIKKTITCVKGAAKKTVKAVNPKCPTGFTLKK
jgi:hypothetical protein